MACQDVKSSAIIQVCMQRPTLAVTLPSCHFNHNSSPHDCDNYTGLLDTLTPYIHISCCIFVIIYFLSFIFFISECYKICDGNWGCLREYFYQRTFIHFFLYNRLWMWRWEHWPLTVLLSGAPHNHYILNFSCNKVSTDTVGTALLTHSHTARICYSILIP